MKLTLLNCVASPNEVGGDRGVIVDVQIDDLGLVIRGVELPGSAELALPGAKCLKFPQGIDFPDQRDETIFHMLTYKAMTAFFADRLFDEGRLGEAYRVSQESKTIAGMNALRADYDDQ